MKNLLFLISLLVLGISGYSQQAQPYKANLDSLKMLKDPFEQEALINRLKQKYPAVNFEGYNFILAYYFVNAKNTEKAISYFKKADARSRTMALSVIPGTIMTYDLKAAETLIEEEISKPGLSDDDRHILVNMRAQVMVKKGDFNRAFADMKEYYDKEPQKSPALNAAYFYLMSKTGAYKEALPQLEKAVLAGVADEEMKKELISAYAKVNPGKDAKAYVVGLVSRFDAKQKEELKTKVLSEPAPNFKVKDVNGKEVSLADFKGKVIVLDFWATWCGPCKKALPAMQMTVNKYKNDPNVKFLFIHTWEKVQDPRGDAIKYFSENGFNLPLYMDIKDPETKINPAVSLFNVSGIPAKFVIDGKGNIRFRTSGFGGTNEAAVNELSEMIELSRKTL